jgi:hypothetical protein
MLPPELLNCDLCILAYQLYHQSVIWPLDPWYEVLARGATDRRTRFMTMAHEYAGDLPAGGNDLYAGPACVGERGGSNTTLDPIITNFAQLRPRDPAWTGDGAVFIGLKAPSYIVDSIRRVSVCTYQGAWASNWPHGDTTLTEVFDYGDGPDELIAFEGGTGSFKGSQAAWSPMGYVLKRTREDGTYDAHIVFRGSRSGNAVRALLAGRDGLFNGPSGNADWVTDMASTLKRDPYVGGEVAVGFAEALKRCMGTLRLALHTLHTRYGAPQTIQVAGHSLGAALASLCVGSLASGVPGVQLRTLLPGWPLDAVQGYFLALPPVGSAAYCASYNTKMNGRTWAPYVAGDPVVECSKSVSLKNTGGAGWVGARMGSGGYSPGQLIRLPRPVGAKSGENSHEIYLIRAAIIHKKNNAEDPIPGDIKNATPWATYVSFKNMLEGKAVSYVLGDPASIITRDNLRRTLVNYRFARHFEGFLDMLKASVADPKSYRGYHANTQYQLAGERVMLALEMCGQIDSDNRNVIVDTVATQVAALIGFRVKKEYMLKGWKLSKQAVADGDGIALLADELLGQDFNTRIGLGLILRALEQKAGTRMADYETVPELKLCLDVSLPDVDGWQKKTQASLR